MIENKQFSGLKAFFEKEGLPNFERVRQVFSELGEDYVFERYFDNGGICDLDIKKNGKCMGKFCFGRWQNRAAVMVSYWKDGLTIFFDEENAFPKLKKVIYEQLGGFEKYYAEKEQNFAHVVPLFDEIEAKVRERIQGKSIVFTTNSLNARTRMGYLSTEKKKVLFRLDFSHEGYKMTVIQNNDMDDETDYDLFEEFESFMADLLCNLGIRENFSNRL